MYVIMDIQPETYMKLFDSYFSTRNICKMNKIIPWLLILPQRGQCNQTERAVFPQSMKAEDTRNSDLQHQRQNMEGQWQRTTKEQNSTTDSGKGPKPDLKKQSGLRVLVHREASRLPNNWTLEALHSKAASHSKVSADYRQNENGTPWTKESFFPDKLSLSQLMDSRSQSLFLEVSGGSLILKAKPISTSTWYATIKMTFVYFAIILHKIIIYVLFLNIILNQWSSNEKCELYA